METLHSEDVGGVLDAALTPTCLKISQQVNRPQASLTVAPPLPIRSVSSRSAHCSPPQHQSRGGSTGRFSRGTSAQSGPDNQSRAESPVAPSCGRRSAGRRGNGLLQLLAAEFAGARLQQQVVASVAHQHGVVQLLVGDGQLQVAAIFAEHITAVSADGCMVND